MEFKDLLYEKGDGVAVITLNRPERMNAFSQDMNQSLKEAFKDADFDKSIRAVILTGAGRGFCAGADVRAGEERRAAAEKAGEKPPERPGGVGIVRRQWMSLEAAGIHQSLAVMRKLCKPIICALNGVAAGAGTSLLLHCDIIVASDQARYRVAFTRLGLTLEFGTSWLLPQRVGTHRAFELAFTNKIIDAREMERIGMVNKVVPHDELMKSAKEMAKEMFVIPPLALEAVRRCVYLGAQTEEHINFESIMTRTFEGEHYADGKEAGKTFRDRSEPTYKWE